jgi:eukaryotic-like serine/threonine-protein kinase
VTTQTSIQTTLSEGDVLAGKYRVEKVLGEGAMGVVVAAMHVHLGERVALKFLKPELAGNPEVVARFLREAQAAARIKGEHIARVSDVGTLESGAPYMVMEYLTGSDLGVIVEKRGKLDVAQAVECVIQACDALAEAHSLGIVHRDLKPSNLFLTARPDGSPLVKVLDFGIAKLLNSDPSKPPLTANGAVIGSPVYMSPEQILGKKTVDARSDVWQLGVILYELVSGACPFDGATLADIMLAIGVHPAKPLRQVRPDAPEALEALIQRCLEKDAAKRLPDVAALAEGLLPFATTRRAHVSVEHIVTLLRGPQAAARLAPMRAQFQSAPLLAMTEASSGVQERSNPYAQTLISQEPSPRTSGSHSSAAQAPPAPPTLISGAPVAAIAPIALMASGAPAVPTKSASQAASRTGSRAMLWLTVGTVVLLLALFAAYRVLTRDAAPAPKAAVPAAAATKTK